jgi:hypothetical protein
MKLAGLVVGSGKKKLINRIHEETIHLKDLGIHMTILLKLIPKE